MKCKPFVVAALLCFTLAPVGPATAERHALVIGVNDCPAFRTGRGVALRKLRGAENDAELIAATLVDHFGFDAEKITTLLGDAATSQSVRTEMDRLTGKLTGDDQLVFYFAGHGTRLADRPPRDELDDGLDEALCLHDTTPTGENLLVDDDLRRWLASLRASRVTVILDSCHSGSGAKGPADGDPGAEYTPRFLKLRGAAAPAIEGDAKPWTELTTVTKAAGTRLLALYACSNEQSAYERRFFDPKPTHRGQFTHYLLAALRTPAKADADADGRLSIAETAAYVSEAIDRDFNTTRPGRRQTPRYESARPSWELIARE